MNEHRSHIAALIIVALAAPAAALLLIVALVVWLAELMGSIILPCLIIGILFALLATIIYKVSLRDALRDFETQFAAIYDFTRILREGLSWALSLFIKRE